MRGTLFRSNTMLMARYSLLLLVFHITSFFQMLPWVFLWGLLTWPWYFVQGMIVDDECKKSGVLDGCQWVLENEGVGAVPSAPAFLRKRFELMYLEATTS